MKTKNIFKLILNLITGSLSYYISIAVGFKPFEWKFIVVSMAIILISSIHFGIAASFFPDNKQENDEN